MTMMTIAIIDDTRLNLTLMQYLVAKLPGVQAVVFLNSAEGLCWCLDNEPDLVVVDYMMPAPDGLEFIERFRSSARHKDVPILMITANQEITVRYSALELGANDFLTKPIDEHEFLARARNMLNLRKSQRALADHNNWLADEVRKATADIRARERETIMRLTLAAEFRDPETGAHLLRMSHYSRLIAAELGWSPEDQDLLLAAAPMHDIGKVGIPDLVLLKRAALTAPEREVMCQHTQIGHDILAGSDSPLLQLGAQIALTHHEKYDGSGYPNGLAGEGIPLAGRIVAVADVFDALLSERPYKQPWPLEDAVQYMKDHRDKHFDPLCLDAFFANWDEVLEIRDRYLD
jgi:putative two-component system response regulator